MKNEFVLAFNEVLEDKQLPKDVVLEALQSAMVSAYRRSVNASNAQQVDAVIDPDTGRVTIFAEKEVVEEVEDARTEVSLEHALKVDPEAQIGSMVIVETTPRNFGRVAAQTARQVIQQRIREAERDAQHDYFSQQIGEILSGVVQAANSQGVTIGLEKKAEGSMPRSHQIPGERFRVHDRVRALLLEVKNSPRGPQILLSRAHRNFLRRLLENEVPEIYHGMVEIRSISREPGQRSKVAVAALQQGVDPVGACVGIRGVRIQAIVRELNDEKIDVIEWSSDPAVYIAKALSPARVSGVYLNEPLSGTKTATVVVPEDQLSLAIGRDGQNARLAAKLTSWRIDIKSLPEAATDALYKLQNDPGYAALAENEAETRPQVETILAKKAEGRPITPEEYQLLTQFVDRVERGLIRQREEVERADFERQRIEMANVPPSAFEMPIEKFEVSDHVYAIVTQAGFDTVGDLLLKLRLEPDEIWKLNGMGPKAMLQLKHALEAIGYAADEIEEEQAEMPEVEVIEAEQLEVTEAVVEPEAGIEAPVPVPAEPIEAAIEEEMIVQVTEEAEGVEAAEEIAPEVETVLEAEQILETEEAEVIEAAAGEAVVSEEAAVSEAELELEQEALDTVFALDTEVFDFGDVDEESYDEEDEEGDDSQRPKKRKKKKKKFVEMEYDPDKDVMVVRKKRKRGDLEWDDKW
jgi:N utilization substance protein A